jgi:transcriptional regulator with XRE-family HTH domain
MEEGKKRIGKFLFKLRMGENLTLREFCKKYGFNASEWSMLENAMWYEYTVNEVLEAYPPLFTSPPIKKSKKKEK